MGGLFATTPHLGLPNRLAHFGTPYNSLQWWGTDTMTKAPVYQPMTVH
jgi:hypothetical protein